MAGEVERIIFEVTTQLGGACRRGDLLDRGVSRSTIDRRIRSGLLVPVGTGLYVLAGREGDRWAMAAAASLAVPVAALSHWTAAERNGFNLPSSDVVHLVVPRDSHVPRLGGVRFHQSRSLSASDVVVLDGLRTTTPARTICDLAAWLRPRRLRHLCEQRLVAAAPTPVELTGCHAALARRGRAGTARLRLVLDELLDDEPFAQSELELALFRLLTDGGLSGFERQFRPPWFDGVRGVVDLAHPRAKVLLEADGRRWHSTRQAFDDDRRRDRLAVGHGWRVLRFGWQEITSRPDDVCAEVARVLQRALAGAA